jgi:hypothetical protein
MQDIKDVCSFNGASTWNIEDLVQSVIVLSTFHRLATVLESMKISVRKLVEEKDKDSSEVSSGFRAGSVRSNSSISSRKVNFEEEEKAKR